MLPLGVMVKRRVLESAFECVLKVQHLAEVSCPSSGRLLEGKQECVRVSDACSLPAGCSITEGDKQTSF